LSDIKDSSEQEVSSLFKVAIGELDKVEKQTEQKKKEIVVKLAESLEGKIPKDSICKKIVEELDGKVSDTLIRECLPEEYKNKRLSDNAKKQKRKKQLEKEGSNLAPQVVLNQHKDKEVEAEVKQQKNKEVVVVGTDGRSYIQRDDQNKPPNTEDENYDVNNSKDKTFTQSSPNQQQQLEQGYRIEESADYLDSQSKDTSHIGLVDSASEDFESPLEEQQQLTANADKIEIVSYNNVTPITDSDILHFEVSRTFKFVQDHLNELISKIGYYGQLCFKGSIDKNSGKVLYFEIEGQNQQHQKQRSNENIRLD